MLVPEGVYRDRVAYLRLFICLFYSSSIVIAVYVWSRQLCMKLSQKWDKRQINMGPFFCVLEIQSGSYLAEATDWLVEQMRRGSYLDWHRVSPRSGVCLPPPPLLLLPVLPHVVNTRQGYQSDIVLQNHFTWHQTTDTPDQPQTNASAITWPSRSSSIQPRSVSELSMWQWKGRSRVKTHQLVLSQEWQRCSGEERRNKEIHML